MLIEEPTGGFDVLGSASDVIEQATRQTSGLAIIPVSREDDERVDRLFAERARCKGRRPL